MSEQSPVYFFKEDDPEWGWLCQWYSSCFHAQDDKIVFKHAEQYMMYHKALAFNDTATATQVLHSSSARECKALGQCIKGFDDKVWDWHKSRVVEEGSYYKFTRAADPEERDSLRARLLATGDRELVEASHFDRVWGVGFGPKKLRAGKKERPPREQWGQNLLGKALMVARARIREEVEGVGGQQG